MPGGSNPFPSEEKSGFWVITEAARDRDHFFSTSHERNPPDDQIHPQTDPLQVRTLVGALAVVALAPATAHALPVNNNEGGGCTYTDKDGYDVPIDEGQDVFVDGKIVSCRGGTIVVTTAPASAGGSTQPSNLPPKVNIGNLPRAAATR